MCGIFLCVSTNPNIASEILSEIEIIIRNRGPDSQYQEDVESLTLDNQSKNSPKLYLKFFGCVLWLRGKCPQKQPLIDKKGGLLLWNGDIFGGVDVNEECDTSLVSENLSNPSTDIPEFISRIQGPYAFIYYQSVINKLWFGRDYFGRHSLLIHKAEDLLILTSVIGGNLINNYNFIEVPADGVYQLDLETFGDLSINLYPFLREKSRDSNQSDKSKIYNNIYPDIGNSLHNTYLNDSISDTLYANVNFDDVEQENILLQLLSNKEYYDIVQQLTNVLKESVRKRVISQPGFCKNCIIKICNQDRKTYDKNHCGHPKISVLFSGGIDCAVIAALAHLTIPPGEELDLINVAFGQESPKEVKCKDVLNQNKTFNVPDRQTGIIAFDELRKAFPERQFNFVMVNVEKCELVSKRTEEIKQLLYPLDTVLDDSIGCAIWFAARGKGVIRNENPTEHQEHYQTPSRVVLLGMGADEQLGGYSRHREKYRREKYEGLLNEIRLGNRNTKTVIYSKLLFNTYFSPFSLSDYNISTSFITFSL